METLHIFRIAETSDELLRCLLVRAIVFMEEQHVSCAEEMDGLDSDALQILGEIDGEPVATARIRFFGDVAKLERLAIRKAWRGHGHGDQLLEFMLATARERGYRKFKLHGQERLRSFYEKHGFRAEGDSFHEANIPHLLMRRED
jgi:predicted GNAT family N-acyltransferase